MADSPYFYARDLVSRAAHHWDYRRKRETHALCGHEFIETIVWEGSERPRAVCRKCQDLLPQYEAELWRQWAQEQVSIERERYEKMDVRYASRIDRLEEKLWRARNDLVEARNRLQSERQKQRAQKKAKPDQQSRPRLPPVRVVSGGLPGSSRRH